MNMKRPWMFFLVIQLFAMSCDDLDVIDTSAPSIEVIEPAMGSSLTAGTFAHFEARFMDDIELATYNIEIHENFGSHSHGRIARIYEDPSLNKWSYKQNFLIPEGLTLFQAVLEDEILVPEDVLAGPYHFIVQAIDMAGNATSFQDDSAVELEVYIENESQALIIISNLVEDELELEVGVRFLVEGTVSDPTIGAYAGIQSIQVILGEGTHDDHEHSHGGRTSEEDLIDIYFEQEDLVPFMVDDILIIDKVFDVINFTISQIQMDDLITEGLDHLLLTIIVFDMQGNVTVSNTDVHLHYE